MIKISLIDIILIILLLMILFGFISMSKENVMLDEECERMGYKKYTYKNGFEFCEDVKGNLRYINSRCNFKISFLDLFPQSCEINKIKIGEVEVWNGN